MKAFRVKYKTAKYRVFSELVIVENESDIPDYLNEHSDKGFIKGHPACKVESIREIDIEELPIREMNIGQLFQLIDSRIQTKQKGDENT